MHTFEVEEAKRVLALSDEIDRRSGLGDLIFRVETAAGRTETGHVIEVDGESSTDGVVLGGMPPDNAHHFVRFDEIVWLGLGYLE